MLPSRQLAPSLLYCSQCACSAWSPQAFCPRILQVLKAYPEPCELLLKITVPKAPVVTLKKDKAAIQLKATAEVVAIHSADVQKLLCLLNIVRTEGQLCQRVLEPSSGQLPPAWLTHTCPLAAGCVLDGSVCC